MGDNNNNNFAFLAITAIVAIVAVFAILQQSTFDVASVGNAVAVDKLSASSNSRFTTTATDSRSVRAIAIDEAYLEARAMEDLGMIFKQSGDKTFLVLPTDSVFFAITRNGGPEKLSSQAMESIAGRQRAAMASEKANVRMTLKELGLQEIASTDFVVNSIVVQGTINAQQQQKLESLGVKIARSSDVDANIAKLQQK